VPHDDMHGDAAGDVEQRKQIWTCLGIAPKDQPINARRRSSPPRQCSRERMTSRDAKASPSFPAAGSTGPLSRSSLFRRANSSRAGSGSDTALSGTRSGQRRSGCAVPAEVGANRTRQIGCSRLHRVSATKLPGAVGDGGAPQWYRGAAWPAAVSPVALSSEARRR
jgi:hypothetical protein